MLDDELLMIPPMVQVGDHSVNVVARAHDDGVHVELRMPDVGSRTYRVLTEGVVADAPAVVDWIRFVAPAVGARLDAEARLRMRQAGYTA